MKILFMILLLLNFVLAAEYEESSDYVLGEGMQVGNMPLYIGGYLSADYTNIQDTGLHKLRADDIAFLAYGSANKFSYMAELEFKEFYVKQWQNGTTNTQKNTKLHIERLYMDYNYNENFVVRGGKFNSPIGYWNMIPINVLRDTSSNPLVNSMIYPKYTTGLDLSYASYGDAEIKVDILVQNNKDLDDDYNNVKVDKHYGLGVEYTADELSLKYNGGYFHTIDPLVTDKNLYYSLIALKYDTDKYKVMGELGTKFNKNSAVVPYSGYIEGLYRITPKHLPTIRFETYESKYFGQTQKDSFLVFGYTYRPVYPVALKAEYQMHQKDAQNKTLLSISVLF